MRVGQDREIRPLAGLVQVGDQGARPLIADETARRGADAGTARLVRVREQGVAAVQAGLLEGACRRWPLVGLIATDRDRTERAVERRVAVIEVTLEFVEVGQYLLPGPLVVPGRDPPSEVLHRAAQRDGAVHG